MRHTYGNSIEIHEPIDPENVPQMFRAVYNTLLAGIKRRGGRPLPETIRIYILDVVKPEIAGYIGVQMEADFTKPSVFEEMRGLSEEIGDEKHERKAGRKGGSKKD